MIADLIKYACRFKRSTQRFPLASGRRLRALGQHALDERKLDQIDVVTTLRDLRVPPGNGLHALVDELAGFHAIRVNAQYRIVFRFEGEHALDVRCTDYH